MFYKELVSIFKDANANGYQVSDSDLVEYTEHIILPNKKHLPHLYRYMPATYYNIRGLETQELFLSSVGSMNDIFEGITCEITDDTIDKLTALDTIAYLKSFSEERNSLLMWAHYADSYSGMCVEYDFSKLPEKYLFHLFPVIYTDTRLAEQSLNFTIAAHKDNIRMNEDNCYPNEPEWLKDILSNFLIKAKPWSYEKEWRLIATYSQIFNSGEDMDDEQTELYDISSQKISVSNCIKAIYLGPRMKTDIKDHIKEIAQKTGISQVYDTKISSKRFEIETV